MLAAVAIAASPASAAKPTRPKPVGAVTVTSRSAAVAAGWSSLSCPEASRCLGLAPTSGVPSILEESSNGGQSFTAAGLPLAAVDATSLACASATFCVLVQDPEPPAVPALTLVTTDRATTFRAVAPPEAKTPGIGYSPGCSATTCYLATSTGALWSLGPTATAWSPVALPTTPDAATWLQSVSCGAGRCVAVGSAGFTSGLLFESDDGGAWTETVAPTLTDPIVTVEHVACGAYACAAFGEETGYVTGALLWSTAEGTWQGTETTSFEAADTVACTATWCGAFGGNWDIGGLAAWQLTGTRPAWNPISVPAGPVASLFTASACTVAVGCLVGAARLYRLALPEATWTTAPMPDGYSGYDEVTCPTPTRCVLAGTLGDGRVAAETSSDGGAKWSGPRPGAETPDPSFAYGLSCVGLTCLLTLYDELHNEGLATRTVDGGAAWSLTASEGTASPLTGVACATATTCVAAVGFDDGDFARTTDGGGSWSPVQPIASPVRSSDVLACESATLCVEVAVTGTGTIDLASHNAGASWARGSVSALQLGDPQLSCVASGVCMLVGAVGRVTVAFRSTSGGLRWTRVAAPRLGQGGVFASLALSCVTSQTCEVAGSNGPATDFWVTVDGASRWVQVAQLASVVDPELACTEHGCVAAATQPNGDLVTLRQSLP